MNMRIAISLALIVAVGVRIVLVLTTGYHLDEEWHYLTARMIDAPLFDRELRFHAHPGLYFLLLKGLLSIHDALISLRVFSLACSLATIAIVGQTIRKLGVSVPVTFLAMLWLASSFQFSLLSIEVRHYSVLILFQSIAIYYAIDLLRLAPEGRVWKRIAVHVSLLAAALTHYSALITAAVIIGLPVLIAACDAGYRVHTLARLTARRIFIHCAAIAVTALPFGLYLVRYPESFRSVSGLGYIGRFVLGPDDSLWRFLITNTGLEFGLLAGLPINHPIVIFPGLALLAVLISRLLRDRMRSEGNAPMARRIDAWFAVLLCAASLGTVLLLSLLSRYPYGGMFRHQAFILPMAVTLGAFVVDEIVGNRSRPRIVAGLTGAIMLISLGQLVVSDRGRASHDQLVSELADQDLSGDLLYVPSHAFIVLAGLHRQSAPCFEEQLDRDRLIVSYPDTPDQVVHAPRILRDFRGFFKLPIADVAFMREIAALLERADVASVTLLDFSTREPDRSAVHAAAGTAQLKVLRFVQFGSLGRLVELGSDDAALNVDRRAER